MTDDVSAGRPSAGFGLEPAQLQALLAEGLHGVDDGELFLEYRETESLTLDDGRLKGAAFDTSKGFGLRAVAGLSRKARPTMNVRTSCRSCGAVTSSCRSRSGTLSRAAVGYVLSVASEVQ